MKKISILTLCSLLVFTFILGEFVNLVHAANETIFDSYTTDIISLETGEVTGTNTFDTKRKVTYLEDNLIEIKLESSVISEYLDGKKSKEIFESTILLNQEEEYFIIDGGEKNYYNPDEYVSFDSFSSDNQYTMSDEGGLSYLTNYWKMTSGNYTIHSYERISNRTSLNGLMIDPGSQAGNRKTGVANAGTHKLAAFKAYADNVYKARTDQIIYGIDLVTTLGITALTWASFWGALMGVGTAAFIANQMWTNWAWADQNVRNAYSLI